MRNPVAVARKPVAANRGVAVRRSKLAYETERAADPLKDMRADPADLEAQQKEIVAKLTASYREQEKKQRENFREANAVGYYRVLVFDTVAQAEAFTRAVEQDVGMQLLDGRAIAEKLGIELPETGWKPKKANPSVKFASRSLPLK